MCRWFSFFWFLSSSSRTRARALWSLGDNGTTNHHHHHRQCHQPKVSPLEMLFLNINEWRMSSTFFYFLSIPTVWKLDLDIGVGCFQFSTHLVYFCVKHNNRKYTNLCEPSTWWFVKGRSISCFPPPEGATSTNGKNKATKGVVQSAKSSWTSFFVFEVREPVKNYLADFFR